MMRRFLLVSVVGLMLAAMSGTPNCPEDGGNSYFTGRTRTSSAGYLLYEYKCMMFGHVFWAKAS